jgi:hypothetical protein
MAQALPALGGNVYPGVQIVMTRSIGKTPDLVGKPFQTIFDPPITIPAGSNISVQGSLQIDNEPTISSEGFNLKITVQPKLADVTHNKRHVDPVRPQWFQTDQQQPKGCPRYAYNATNGFTTAVPYYNRSQHFGTIIPGGDALKTLQIPADPMNTISALSDSHCYMYPYVYYDSAAPVTYMHLPLASYETASALMGVRCSKAQYEGYTNDIAREGYRPFGPYVASYASTVTTTPLAVDCANQGLIPVPPGTMHVSLGDFAVPCFSQSVYIPYQTAVSVNSVSPFYTMAQTYNYSGMPNIGTALPAQQLIIPNGCPGNATTINYLAGQTGIDFWARASQSASWTNYESGAFTSVSPQNTGLVGTWNLAQMMYRGLPQINAGNIMFNAHIVPNTKWIYKPLERYNANPDANYIRCSVYSYSDVLSSSPYAQVLQACSVTKATTVAAAPGNIFRPLGSGLPNADTSFVAPNIDPKVTPMVLSSARNTTMLNAPLFYESYVTQIGCVIPWDWNRSSLFSSPSSAFHFRITNGIETFNELTDPPMSRQTSLNLNRFIQELTQSVIKGTVGGLIPTGETFSPPPPQLATPFARLFINQPGSFYSPFVTQNQHILRQLHPAQPSDLSGNFYDNRCIQSGTYAQDKTAIANGPYLQNTWRPTPYGGFADFSVPLEFVSRPTSFLRLPAVHCPKPVTDVLWGKGRSVPRITDPTMPPPKPYGFQTFWSTIETGSTLLYENNIPALDLSRAALEAMGTRADYVLMNFIKLTWDVQDAQTGGGTSMTVLPFTWWGYTSTKYTCDELYSAGNFSSNNMWSTRIPYLGVAVLGSGQDGFVTNGDQQITWNSTTSPWGLNPAFPVVGLNDLVAIPVTSGTPGYASCEPLLGWIYPNSPLAPKSTDPDVVNLLNPYSPERIAQTKNVAFNFENIGFAVSGGLTSLSSSGYKQSTQEPTAGCHTVAGRAIVQSGWAYPFKYNESMGSYCDPFMVTCNIQIAPGRYSYTALANTINVALNDPDCDYAQLTCNLLDDAGSETTIPGCINNIGYDPVYHNVLWTNASSKETSKNLPPRLTPKTLFQTMQKCSPHLHFTLEQLTSMFPPEFYDSSLPDSRVVTAFRAADDVQLLANLTLNYSETGNYFFSGAVAAYDPPGGTAQGYGDGASNVASYAAGWYTRCPEDPQAIGIVQGASVKNPSNSASFDSDPVFIAYGYPYYTDVTLNDGAAGPINPLRNFTGGFAFSDLTRSSFTNVEYTQNYSGMSTTMKGTMEPTAMNGAVNWIGASAAVLRVLGPFLFCSKFNGPADYLHLSPIVNPTRVLAFQGLSGVTIMKISGLNSKDTKYIHDFFGLAQGVYEQTGSLSHLQFSEGEAYLYDTVNNNVGWIYDANHFCYLSPHETDSPIFTARLFPSRNDWRVAESSFSAPGESLRPNAWNAPGAHPLFQPLTADDRYGSGGYAPFPTNNRYYSLGSLCEVLYENASTIQYGYVDNKAAYDASAPIAEPVDVIDPGAGGAIAVGVAGATQPNDLNWEHSVLFHIHKAMEFTMVFDLPPLPAAHGMMSCLSMYDSIAARLYMPNMTATMGDAPGTSFAAGNYLSNLTGLANIGVWPFSAPPTQCYIGPAYPTGGIRHRDRPDWRIKRDTVYSSWVPDYLHMQACMTKYELDEFSQYNAATSGSFPAYDFAALLVPDTPPPDDPWCNMWSARAQFQVRNNAMGHLYKTSNCFGLPTGAGRYPGAPVTIQCPVTADFLYRNAWPPVPSVARPAYLFPSLAYTNPVTSHFTNNLNFHQSLVMLGSTGEGYIRSNGYLNGLSYCVDLGCNFNAMSTAGAFPIPVLANGASNNNTKAWSSQYWDPVIPDQNPILAPGNNSIDNVTYRLRSWSPDLSTYFRAHLGRLEQTVSQGPNPDGFLHWYLNVWQPPGFGSYMNAAGHPSVYIGSALPPTSCLYGATHSAFTYHAYRIQNFGPLQSIIIPPIRERECMDPMLRASLGAQGFSRVYKAGASGQISDPNGSVQTFGMFHYQPVGIEAVTAPGDSVASFTHRVLAPLSYVPKDLYSASALTPNYICRLNVGNGRTYYDTLRYDYSLLSLFRACIPPTLDVGLYGVGDGTTWNLDRFQNMWATVASNQQETLVAQSTYCPPFTLGPKAFYDQMQSYTAYPGKKCQPNSWYANRMSGSIQDLQQLLTWAFSTDTRTLVNAIGFIPLSAEVVLTNGIGSNPVPLDRPDATEIFIWRPPVSWTDVLYTFYAQNTVQGVIGPSLPVTQPLSLPYYEPTPGGIPVTLEGTSAISNGEMHTMLTEVNVGGEPYNAGPLVRTPAPIRISWLYPSNCTSPSTTYMRQTHVWSNQSGNDGVRIMEYENFRWHSSAQNGFCYAKTPCILNVIGRLGFNSSTYSSLGCFGPPSTDILIALGYNLPKYGPSHLASNNTWYDAPDAVRPPYVPLASINGEQIWQKIVYEQRHQIARRFAFYSQPPSDLMTFPMPLSSTKINPYTSDSYYSGPTINFNDSTPTDINPTLFSAPNFTTWDLPPAAAQQFGSVYLVKMECVPSILTHRCDIRVNMSDSADSTVNTRFLDHEVLIPTPQPTENSEVSDYTYQFTCPPPLEDCQLTSLNLSITNLNFEEVSNVFSHSVSINISPSVNPPQLSGYGTVNGEISNANVPRLAYQRL